MAELIQDILNNPQQLKEISNAAFQQADSDKSGQLDAKELGVLMRELLADQGITSAGALEEEDIQRVLGMLDTDKDGKVNPAEFEIFTRRTLEGMLQQLQKKAN